jgi:hypothetical protein
MTTLAEYPMAKRNDVYDVSVKVDADVIHDAKIVAAYRDVTLAEYLTELIRPLVARDLDHEAAKRGSLTRRREAK